MTERSIDQIYTVSGLTREIKTLFEESFPFIWIKGEISNYSLPASGHAFFTLKDPQATIQAVIFKKQRLKLKFNLEDGINIYGLARLTIYEPRGAYQLIFEHIEPMGSGLIQIAFEQLKHKLSDKGYFDQKYKKPIPFLPSKICVITSITGAVLKDILHISKRRFSNCYLEILPVKVQGAGSENEIVDAIDLANNQRHADLIILSRGGGSLEDLAPFNSEVVAEAIFRSKIPIITGIGHETDFTIADFVSDLRAPTPSAAAELSLPDKQILVERVFDLEERLKKNVLNIAFNLHFRINSLWHMMSHHLYVILNKNKTKHHELNSQLEVLSPLSVLRRGYSISRFALNKKIITDSAQVNQGNKLEIILYKGRIITSVENING